jgi:hypothetical protein
MGEYDNYIYNEIVGIHELMKEMNKSLKSLSEEVKGLRNDSHKA